MVSLTLRKPGLVRLPLRILRGYGWFHIQRLRLNRVQLIELRLQRTEGQRLRETLEHNQRANARLREYVRELEQETERLLQIIVELTGE